ncbi:MAG: hypothetical protein VZR54_06255 [Ruminococcus sp.]|nr:hypothetical protein [Ruminococcus sp.]
MNAEQNTDVVSLEKENIPILYEEFDEYLRESAKKEQLYSIGFFDILGFSNYVEQNGTKVIMDLYQRLLDLVYSQESSKEGENRRTGAVPVPVSGDCKNSFYVAQGNGFVNVIHFSDTFLIYVNYDIIPQPFWLRDSKYEPHPLTYNEIDALLYKGFFDNPSIFPSFLQTCMEFFCSALYAGIPLRGSISTGLATMDKFRDIYIGKPLVEAAKGEPERKSIGITYGKSFCHYHSLYNDFHIPFLSHTKNGFDSVKYLSPMAVDWPRYWRTHPEFSKESIENCIMKMNHKEQFSYYYTNAIDFSKFSERHQNWSQEVNWEGITDIFDFYDRAKQWHDTAIGNE